MRFFVFAILCCVFTAAMLVSPGFAISAQREKLSVLPSSFSPESKRNYPDWIEHMQSSGYGNAIWQELEDILYDSNHYDLVMEPPTVSEEFRNILSAKKSRDEAVTMNIELPDRILTINVNFFVSKNESIRGTTLTRKESFHSTVHLRFYDFHGNALNRAIPATGDGVDPDLIQATRMATRNAAEKLLRRLGKI